MNPQKHTALDLVILVLIAAYELAICIFTLLWLFTDRLSIKPGIEKVVFTDGPKLTVTYGLFMAGALGGAFYCLRSLYQRLADAYTPADGKVPENPTQVLNVRVWSLWYLYRPLQGGVLALILLCLTSSDLLLLGTGKPEVTSFYVYVALGFLAGVGSHQVMAKIEELIGVMFSKATVKTKTPPPEPAPAAGATTPTPDEVG